MSEWSSFLNVLECLTNKLTLILAFTEEVYNKYPTLEVDYQKVLEFYQFLLNVPEHNVIICIGVWTLSLLQVSFFPGPCSTTLSTNNDFFVHSIVGAKVHVPFTMSWLLCISPPFQRYMLLTSPFFQIS